MAEFFCKKHNTVWFMRGRMKGYAHPVVDEDGNKTGEWCNMPSPSDAEEVKQASTPSTAPDKDHLVKEATKIANMSKDDWAEKDRITRKSIERQTALKEAVNLATLHPELATGDKVIATAKKFEKYIETGD